MLSRYAHSTLVWVDLTSPTPQEVRSLIEEFDIDPSIAQELLVPSFRQRAERKGEMMYIALHFSALRGMGRRPEQEIDFIIGKHFLITTRYETSDPLHAFAKAFEVDSVLGENYSHTHGGHLFVAMVRNLYRALAEECELLERRLVEIEERIFEGHERHMVSEISQTTRIIHDFRQSLIPHRDMIASLEPTANRLFGPEFSYYIRDLERVYMHVEHTLNNLRDALVELRETNNSLLTTKQNETMKTLTLLTFVFLPTLSVSGIYGIVSQFVPGGHIYLLWSILGIMVVITLSWLWYFKRRGWL